MYIYIYKFSCGMVHCSLGLQHAEHIKLMYDCLILDSLWRESRKMMRGVASLAILKRKLKLLKSPLKS